MIGLLTEFRDVLIVHSPILLLIGYIGWKLNKKIDEYKLNTGDKINCVIRKIDQCKTAINLLHKKNGIDI